jgi:hypothetical protein
LSFCEGVGVLKIEESESESEVLRIEESESELLCTDSTALVREQLEDIRITQRRALQKQKVRTWAELIPIRKRLTGCCECGCEPFCSIRQGCLDQVRNY